MKYIYGMVLFLVVGFQVTVTSAFIFFKFPTNLFNFPSLTRTTTTTTTTAATTTVASGTTIASTSATSAPSSSNTSNSSNATFQTQAAVSIGNRENTTAGLTDYGQNISNIIVSFGQRTRRDIFEDFDEFDPNPTIGSRKNTTTGLIDHGQNISNVFISYIKHYKRSIITDLGEYTQEATDSVAENLENQIRIFSCQLENDRRKLIEIGANGLRKELNKIKMTGERVTDGAKSLSDQSVEQIRSINDYVSGLGQNISDCFNDNPFPYDDLIIKTVEAVKTCIEDKIDEATTISQQTRNMLKNSYNGTIEGHSSIEICNRNFFRNDTVLQIARISCLGKALLAIQSQRILVPVEFAKRIAEIRSYFATIESDVLQCATNIAEEVANLAYEASQKIRSCISDKQNS